MEVFQNSFSCLKCGNPRCYVALYTHNDDLLHSNVGYLRLTLGCPVCGTKSFFTFERVVAFLDDGNPFNDDVIPFSYDDDDLPF